MSIRSTIFFLSLLALACATGCHERPQQSQEGRVVAKVNGTALTDRDLDFQQEKGHGGAPKVTRSVDDVINQELLYQQGIKLGLDKAPDYRALLAKLDRKPPAAKRIELARRVFNTQIAAKIDIRHQDVQEYYAKNIDKISTRLHLLMIKVADEKQAGDLLKKIRGGEKFESVARTVMGSTPGAGREPWDLGFVKWEDVPVDFEKELYGMKNGDVSEVLGNQQAGFQIVKLIESRKGPKVGFDSIHAPLMNRLRDARLLESYNHYVEDLRKNAKIEKF